MTGWLGMLDLVVVFSGLVVVVFAVGVVEVLLLAAVFWFGERRAAARARRPRLGACMIFGRGRCASLPSPPCPAAKIHQPPCPGWCCGVLDASSAGVSSHPVLLDGLSRRGSIKRGARRRPGKRSRPATGQWHGSRVRDRRLMLWRESGPAVRCPVEKDSR